MKKILFAAVMMSLILVISGCGGGGSSSPPPTVVTQILSRSAFDGYIRFDFPNVFTVTQGNVPSVLAGIAFTTIIPPVSRADVLRHVTVDVTSLMVEAQRRGLPDFQIRILEDDGFVFPGLIEIDDTTINLAPLLTVTYF